MNGLNHNLRDGINSFLEFYREGESHHSGWVHVAAIQQTEKNRNQSLIA
jgi:hypothetical protein